MQRPLAQNISNEIRELRRRYLNFNTAHDIDMQQMNEIDQLL